MTGSSIFETQYPGPRWVGIIAVFILPENGNVLMKKWKSSKEEQQV